MKTLLTTLSAALTLTAGLAHAAPFVNHYDALLTGSADSDGSIELQDYQSRQSLPDSFIPSIDVLYAGSPDSDRSHELRDHVARRSLPLDFVPSVDSWIAGTPDADGTVAIRADGKACPLTAAKKGIC